ncbi:MAG: hypothetical protein ACQETX_09865 [Pseudomonadota bacterium]
MNQPQVIVASVKRMVSLQVMIKSPEAFCDFICFNTFKMLPAIVELADLKERVGKLDPEFGIVPISKRFLPIMDGLPVVFAFSMDVRKTGIQQPLVRSR